MIIGYVYRSHGFFPQLGAIVAGVECNSFCDFQWASGDCVIPLRSINIIDEIHDTTNWVQFTFHHIF